MRKRKTRQLSTVDGALQSAFTRLGLSGKLAQQRALVIWPEVVGPQIAAATRPLHVRDGILFVATKSSTWAHELIFRKAAILAGLEQVLGKGVLNDIRFLGRGYRDPEVASAPEGRVEPGPQEWGEVSLTADDQALLEERLQEVHDAELRARLERVMAHDLRARRWKEAHGWPRCPQCGLPHAGPAAECHLCRPRWTGRP